MSNNTSKQKLTAVAMVGAVVAAALVAAVSFSPIAASAQERGELADPQYRFRLARGAGIATNIETGENFRTGLRVMTLYDNSADEHKVERGAIVISVDGERVRYDMLPGTWEIAVAEDGLAFEATGQVQNDETEERFDVSLDGYFGIHTQRGSMWSVEGTMTGDLDYDLHYVILSHPWASFVESEIQ